MADRHLPLLLVREEGTTLAAPTSSVGTARSTPTGRRPTPGPQVLPPAAVTGCGDFRELGPSNRRVPDNQSVESGTRPHSRRKGHREDQTPPVDGQLQHLRWRRVGRPVAMLAAQHEHRQQHTPATTEGRPR